MIIFILLPSKYNGLIIGAHTIIALSIIILFFLLPFLFLIILVLDLIKKRYKIVLKNIIIIVLLFLGSYGLKKYILDVYVYETYEEPTDLPMAQPPMEYE
ncbi:MAG TPA: hypothetical protein VLZ11_04955 [Flavobacterium sp.]|nr:hypothetical protein [Flavobacterium sp.]